MLNLNNPIVYNAEEKQKIEELLTNNKDKSGSELWDLAPKGLKNRISLHTLKEQKCRCAYCENLFVLGVNEIEHIVSKGKHKEYCFEPLNLVSSCRSCNGVQAKGSKDTIMPNAPGTPYETNTFLIVHPYLNDVDKEIIFADEDHTVFDLEKCTELGKATIKFFHWDEDWYKITRPLTAKARTAILTDETLMKLIEDIVCYRPK